MKEGTKRFEYFNKNMEEWNEKVMFLVRTSKTHVEYCPMELNRNFRSPSKN